MSSRIYKLTSQQTPKIYIGSTKLTLNTRFILHKTKYKNQVKYITANELLQYPDCKIELIEECDLNKNDLRKKEGEYIKFLDCVNSNIAGRDAKQYYKDNLAKFQEVNKKFRQDNKNYFTEYYQNNKENYNKKIDCDCSGSYCFFTKSNHFKTKKHIKYEESKKA